MDVCLCVCQGVYPRAGVCVSARVYIHVLVSVCLCVCQGVYPRAGVCMSARVYIHVLVSVCLPGCISTCWCLCGCQGIYLRRGVCVYARVYMYIYVVVSVCLCTVGQIQGAAGVRSDVRPALVRPSGRVRQREDDGTLHSQQCPRLLIFLQVSRLSFESACFPSI